MTDAPPARLRLGMVGGGRGAFIGETHRIATLYRDYADILAARQAGEVPDPLALWAPMVEEGARGIAFVGAALNSHSEGGRWLEFQKQF